MHPPRFTELVTLQDLVQLSLLQNLHSLSLCDPAYPPNPVCRLCNYSTYAIYHLPHLYWLDDREVKGHQLQHIVQTIVANKKLYYRMRVHQALVTCLQECRGLEAKKVSICETKLAAIRMLTWHIKSVRLSDNYSAHSIHSIATSSVESSRK